MKFDFVIGNPPYQESIEGYNRQEPIYTHFYDMAKEVGEKYLLITPARFLFNNGLTSKAWNKKMLSDPSLRVEKYFPDSSTVFANTEINGGVAIVYRDGKRKGKAIGHYIPNLDLRSLASRFIPSTEHTLDFYTYGGRSALKLNELFLRDYPDAPERVLAHIKEKNPRIKKLEPGEECEIKSSSFSRTAWLFQDEEPKNKKNYYRILGSEGGRRVFKWIPRKYCVARFPENNNIEGYKVFVSCSDGAAGQIGKPVPARILGRPVLGQPNESSLPTFLSIGNFESIKEAENLEKYLETKFCRALVGVMKITQHITSNTFSYVPLQNFKEDSDINWNVSVEEIDRQLYRKYSLTNSEVAFIEGHIQEIER